MRWSWTKLVHLAFIDSIALFNFFLVLSRSSLSGSIYIMSLFKYSKRNIAHLEYFTSQRNFVSKLFRIVAVKLSFTLEMTSSNWITCIGFFRFYIRIKKSQIWTFIKMSSYGKPLIFREGLLVFYSNFSWFCLAWKWMMTFEKIKLVRNLWVVNFFEWKLFHWDTK